MERIDDLLANGLRLIQDEDSFCFGSDAVELANFVTGGDKDRAVDLGCGNGIITVLLAGKKGISTIGVDIDSDACDLARRNIALNSLENRASIINLPLQKLGEVMDRGSASIVAVNPPYFKAGSGSAPVGARAAARHELSVTLAEVVDCAAYLLPTGGRFFIVYTVDRLAELMGKCVNLGLEPKELVLLDSSKALNMSVLTGDTDISNEEEMDKNAEEKLPKLCLLRCVKGGKTGLRVVVRGLKYFP